MPGSAAYTPGMPSLRLLAAVLAIALVATASPSDAYAQDDAVADSPHTIGYQNLFTGRANPLGLIDRFQIFYRYRLYESDSAALEQNHVGVTILPTIAPAFFGIGPAVDVQPLSLLNLRAQYEWFGYFGSSDLFQSFDSIEVDYSDDALEALGTNYSTTGTQLTLSGLLQLKVGPIAARSNFRAIYSDFDLRAGDTAYYDVVNDVLAPDDGWIYTNDADVLWLSDFGLIVGARYTTTWADET